MSTVAPARHSIQQIIGIALRGELTDELAAIAGEMGPEATCAVMLAASRRIAELVGASAQGPHTPSGPSRPTPGPRHRSVVGARSGRSRATKVIVAMRPSASIDASTSGN
ncbi:MAG: hypothetical protein IIB54_10490 [Planctomycetes bacterium]|nr:hypothetical protein [Planctomycetota bacterium]